MDGYSKSPQHTHTPPRTRGKSEKWINFRRLLGRLSSDLSQEKHHKFYFITKSHISFIECSMAFSFYSLKTISRHSSESMFIFWLDIVKILSLRKN